MIFFEGFGSLFPYIISLSLIWVCLIFGLRGQILEVLHIPTTRKLDISPASLKTNDSGIFHYYDYSKIEHKSEKKLNSISSVNDFNFLSDTNDQISKIFETDTYIPTGYFYHFLRRGPPATVS
jgi:hypothetical protein